MVTVRCPECGKSRDLKVQPRSPSGKLVNERVCKACSIKKNKDTFQLPGHFRKAAGTKDKYF